MKGRRFNKNSFYRKLNLDKQSKAVIRWFNKIKPKMLADLKQTRNNN